jgi:periplasmic divalent cation tolerance protein
MDANLKIVYITAPSKQIAIELGRKLVESRHAGCVNVLPQMTSIYWWEGKISESEEAVLLVKTSEEKVDALIAEVEKIHPYSIPCALSLPVDRSAKAYALWLHANIT